MGILPLLLLALPSAGVALQPLGTINVSLGSELTFQCLHQAASNSTGMKVVWFRTQDKTEGMREQDGVTCLPKENGSVNLIFTNLNETHAGNYTCGMRSMSNTGDGTSENCQESGSQPGGSVTVLCRFQMWLSDQTMHVTWAEQQDISKHTEGYDPGPMHSGMGAASTEPEVCKVSNSSVTGTEDPTQGTVSSSGLELSLTPKPLTLQEIICLFVIPGSVVGVLFLLLCVLVCLCRRKRRKAEGNLESKRVAEMNQVSTPPRASQTEDVTYAKLSFETAGAAPAASEVVYTEIKPLRKK